MQGVPEEIQRRQIALFAKCDASYGGVREACRHFLTRISDKLTAEVQDARM